MQIINLFLIAIQSIGEKNIILIKLINCNKLSYGEDNCKVVL